MTDVSRRSRRPDGAPTGGQFATEHRPEAVAIDLDAQREAWRTFDRNGFRAAHVDEFVSDSAYREKWSPEGYTTVRAIRQSDGAVRTFLLPSAEVAAHHGVLFVVDPQSTIDVTDVAEIADPPPVLVADLGFDVTGFAEVDAQSARNEMFDGDPSLAELIEQSGGVTGKMLAPNDNGTAIPVLDLADGASVGVSLPTFKALRAVPDTTSDVARAQIAEYQARAVRKRATAGNRALADAALATALAQRLAAESARARAQAALDERCRQMAQERVATHRRTS